MYDAIIVGGRCAGSATGMLLAKMGYKVLIIDRATFPSDTISGHFIWYWGAAKLQKWGLLDRVIESGCPPIHTISSNYGDFTLTGYVPPVDGVPLGVGPRRTILDSILLDAATQAGAEIRQGFALDKLMLDGERVIGIEGHDVQSRKKSREFARIVIGADGKRSRVAQRVDAPIYHEVPSLTCWYMSYWSNMPVTGLELHWRNQRVVLAMPTHDQQVLVAVAWTRDEFEQFRGDIDGNYLATLRMMPDLAEKIVDARRSSEYVGMADLPNFFRKPYGEGWALVGDAGHHRDPLPAYGMSDAFCDAELLADAIHSGFSGETPLVDALARYETMRNERAIPDHETTCQRARLIGWDTPEMLGLRAALRNNETDTSKFMAALCRMPGANAFFAPDNIKRIIMQVMPVQN